MVTGHGRSSTHQATESIDDDLPMDALCCALRWAGGPSTA